MHGISVPVVVNNMSSRTNQTNTPQFKAIDFFCGGGGMTCGLRQAGIDVIAGVDFDKCRSRVNEGAFRNVVYVR